MAITQANIQALTDKFKTMDKASALAYIKSQKDAILANPEMQTAISTAYTQAFTNVTTPPNTFTQPTGTPPATTTPPASTPPAPVVGNTMDSSTGAPYVAPTPVIPGGFSFKWGELGTGKDHTFTPTRTTTNGFAINDNGANEQDKLGLTTAQLSDLTKYMTSLKASGVPTVDVTKLSSDLIKQYQKNNSTLKTHGITSGTKREDIPTDPTAAKGTVGSMIDLNNNGIPDSQEWFGFDETGKPKETGFFTFADNPLGKSYNIDITNWSDFEKTIGAYNTDMTQYEVDAKKRAADAAMTITNENSKRIIDTNNAMIGSIQGLLTERLDQNKEQYKDAVGSVYSQLGGQVKALQRVIGTDGKAIDDATMLSLMGWVGVESMQKIVDLKNKLVNDYLGQKDQAIKQIYALQKDNALSANEASAAVEAIRAQAEVDVIDMTKTFYKQMFGITDASQKSADATNTSTRAAVTSYLSALGLTPTQVNQLVNNYVNQGKTTEEALRLLSEDIRDGKNPTLKFLEDNNKVAAEAAKAKFAQDMALKVEPIITKWQVDLQLQKDKQAFEAQQNALDRAVKRAGLQSTGSSKKLTGPQLLDANRRLQVSGKTDGVFDPNITENDKKAFDSAVALIATGTKNTYADNTVKKYVPSGMTAQQATDYLKDAAK